MGSEIRTKERVQPKKKSEANRGFALCFMGFTLFFRVESRYNINIKTSCTITTRRNMQTG